MKHKKKVLKNGLKVVTVPMKDNQTATVLVLVEAGSKYEDKKNNGISHFLEHMNFKGTENRPDVSDISLELDSLGSQSNAFTSHEFTGYWAKSNAKNVKKVIDIISDMYLNPLLDENEIKKEKGVILEEFNMYQDLPMRSVNDLFMNLLYEDQPTGMKILGEKENINNFKRDDFIEYRKKHYVADATTVIVAGNINEREVIKEIENKFKNISTAKKHKKIKVKDTQKENAIALEYKKTDQTHFILGTRAFDQFHKDSIVASMIAGVLSGGMSGRLFRKLRDEMGVCYYVRATNEAFTDHGSFEIASGVDNKRVKEVVSVLLSEMKKLKEKKVSDKELKKVKDYIIGNIILGLEASDSWAEYYGIQDVLGREIESPKEKIKKIKEVTAEDIQRVAKKIFKDGNLNLALIGPFKDQKEFKNLLKI
ncbi:M16 family metallopeptidase [Patescibacteria group bacterium]